VPEPYQGDDSDDARYAGWSYLGDRYVCPLADDDRTCHRRANLLLAQNRETDLRAMADEGHRCAFVRLMELLVNQHRVDDLHAMAIRGDNRAETTLVEYLSRARDEAGLRAAAADLPSANLALAELLAASGRIDDAITVLDGLADNPDYAHVARRLAIQLRQGGHRRASPQQ
jgi:hypothetical protein